MATSEGIPSSIDIEFLELNDNPYIYIRYPREERLPAIHHDQRSLPQNAISASNPTNKSAKDKQNLS